MEQIEKIILPNIALIFRQYVIIRLVRIDKGTDINFCSRNGNIIFKTRRQKALPEHTPLPAHTNPLVTLGSFRPFHQGIIIRGFQFSLFPTFI